MDLSKLNPNTPGGKVNLNKLNEVFKHQELNIAFFATPQLKEMIMQNKHPIIQQLPDTYKGILLAGEGYLITKQMVYKWIEGTLDQRQTFMLNHGDIRVTMNKDGFVKELSIKGDK